MDPEQEFEQHFNQASDALRVKDSEQEPAPADPAKSSPAPDPADPPAANEPPPTAPADPAPANVELPAPAPAMSLEQLQAAVRELERKERASAARASQTQRENNRLAALVKELQQGRAAPPASAPAPAPALDDVLAKAPDLAAAVDARIKAAVQPLSQTVEKTVGEVSRVVQVVDPIAEKRVRDEIADTHTKLDGQFGKAWRETVNSDSFDAWLQKQPKWVQDLYDGSPSYEDSATVLGRFYAVHGFPTKTPAPPAPPAASPGATAPAAATDPNARLRQAAGIPARTPSRPAPQGPSEDDFDGHFALAAAQLNRARG